jgi:hypothetical protein
VHFTNSRSSIDGSASHIRRLVILFLIAWAAIVICLSILAPFSRPSGADQVGSLRAQAKAISHELIQEQLEVGAYQQQYSVATEKVVDDQRAIVATQLQIQSDAREIASRTRDVRELALMSYVMSGSVSPASGPSLFSENVETIKSENVYATLSLGNLNQAISQLRTAQRAAQSAQVTLLQQQAADKSEQDREASYLQASNSTAQQLASVQGEVTGQLTAAVDQENAIAAAAAAAAVAAAERHSVDLSSTTVDPALNPFLQCVRQAESGGNYAAVSPNGEYMGAFQFSQPTWNYAANAAGRDDLVGVPPNEASKPDQDTVAVALYSLDGERPWLGDRCS